MMLALAVAAGCGKTDGAGLISEAAAGSEISVDESAATTADAAGADKTDAQEEAKADAAEEVKADAAYEAKTDAANEVKTDAGEEVKAEAEDESEIDAAEEAETDAAYEAKTDAADEIGFDTSDDVREGEFYYDLDHVILYLETYGELPDNYVTKKAARALGWEGGSVQKYIEGAAIGGDRFSNYEGTLPDKKGRKYFECDIDTDGKGSRGPKRLVYSDDGLYFYTEDHYDTFTEYTVNGEDEVVAK